MQIEWKPVSDKEDIYEGRDRNSGKLKWTATSVDLVFGSNAQLRALVEVYAGRGTKHKFIDDFIKAWNKVMNADRFEIR